MKITSATFAGSSTKAEQRPARRLPEFAFIGRSNVGKSSLINMLCNNSRLAMTSSTPGKTKLVNHFLINDNWYLVDLPGYGYAKLDKKGKDELRRLIDSYICGSEDLMNLFVLIDSRYDITRIDLDFIHQLGERGIPFSIIYTKADKVGVNVLKATIERNCTVLREEWEELPDMLVSSSEDRKGREEILAYIENILKTI